MNTNVHKFVIAIFALSCCLSVAADFSQEDIGAAESRKRSEIEAIEEEIRLIEENKREASKRGNRDVVRECISEIKDAKLRLAKTKKRSLEDYAKEIRLEREQAPAMVAAEKARKQAAAEEAQAELEAQQLSDKAEAERLRLSGGCPLKILGANFFHVDAEAARLGSYAKILPANLVGDSTIVVYELENRGSNAVEAYEIFIEFLNGFDEVVRERTLQGTLIQPEEKRRTVDGIPEVETATQVRVRVNRAKHVNGALWVRLPDHKNTGVIVKLPEGADKVE